MLAIIEQLLACPTLPTDDENLAIKGGRIVLLKSSHFISQSSIYQFQVILVVLRRFLKVNHHLHHFPSKEGSKAQLNLKKLELMGCDGEIDDMLRIWVREAESNEEIFTSVVWIRAFNINEQIYAELCHEFYSTYEFDEVCASDELQTKKIIKFRLGGRAHSLTLLEFAQRLGLYQATELDEDDFNVYFEGGLRSDVHFNAQEYWLRISRAENLGLSRSHTSTIRNPILRVIHKMITYDLCQKTTGYDKIQKSNLWLLSMFDARHQNGYANVAWLIARWMKRKGAGTQSESQICCGKFITKLARKTRVLTDDDGSYRDTSGDDREDGVQTVISLGQVPWSVRAHGWDQYYQQYPPQYHPPQQQHDDDE
ncbi:hypothetical protein Tco_0684542 [Tanacetum coccineum]